MKISKRRLKQIIKEEVRRALHEAATIDDYAYEDLSAAEQARYIQVSRDHRSGEPSWSLRSDLSADEIARIEEKEAHAKAWYGDRSRERYDKDKWEYRSDQEFGNRGYQGEEGWEPSHVDRWAGSTYRRPRRK